MKNLLFNWITKERKPPYLPPSNIKKIAELIQPADVLLIQGYNRLADPMEYVTHSIWTHATLCIGRLKDIKDSTLKERIQNHYNGDPNEILLIEGIVGKVAQVIPLSKYQHHHLRLCRPIKLSADAKEKVVKYATSAVGQDISLWQIGRLLRLLLSWIILPNFIFKLFYQVRNGFRQKICSSLIAECFASANFPILPEYKRARDGHYYTEELPYHYFYPAMVDYSPHFDIIKYPLELL